MGPLRGLRLPLGRDGELRTIAKQGWTDGPEAVAAVRNQVVHLKRPRVDHHRNVWVDVWLLTTHDVELALARGRFIGEETV